MCSSLVDEFSEMILKKESPQISVLSKSEGCWVLWAKNGENAVSTVACCCNRHCGIWLGRYLMWA